MITGDAIQKIGIPGLLAIGLIWMATAFKGEQQARKEAEERVIALQQTYHDLVVRMVDTE